MAVFKCKMCGGELDINEGVSVVECEYCGTKQTVPIAKDENLHPLFNRANTLRIKGEFDKAEKIYEKIIGADETQAEAYWGLILCKYGIEYVEDPATFRRVPTCHRASFDSIVADDDYKTALKYADGVQRGVYESEAAEIDRIQKEILALSQKEEPYDVFICYKETDETGRRTQDSVIANDIYHQLSQEGFKVFYAAITLEDKLGSVYEPCIFSALNSVKVMLVIGTKPEYFNAVWVKNEWSRYLKLMKNDRSRILIPCYRDMDAYDLPEEFSHLQAQDMSKIGFINDVVRGIKKIIVKDESKKEYENNVNANIAPLLKRAFMFLEDGEWSNADEYCEKILDINPECAEAYLGKLLAKLKLKKQNDLKNLAEPFDNFGYYQKIMRFADDTLKSFLVDAITGIKNRILEEKYVVALQLKENAKTDSDYANAAKAFKELGDYKDSTSIMSECQSAVDEILDEGQYKNALSILERAISEQELLVGIEILDSLGDYRDSIELKTKYKQSWHLNKELAMSIWSEYCSVNDKILEITAKIEENKSRSEKLKKKLEKTKQQLKDVQKKSDQMADLESQLKTIQQQLTQANNELSSLGIFAFSKKKEISAHIQELSSAEISISDKISQAKKFINESYSIGALQTTIEITESKIAENRDYLTSLNDSLEPLIAQITPIVKKLENRQTIAILAQNEKIIPLLVGEHALAMIIKADEELRSMIINSGVVFMIPKDKQKSIFGNNIFDAEAIYYQACQAMETAKSIDDIKWARGEFAAIRRYKDSNQRLAKCEEMIVNNTYKL